MGGPLSALVAEVYMCSLEDQILSSPSSPSLFFWSRYVDDVFAIWTGTDEGLSSFLPFLNSLHPSIEFTLEMGGSSIPFLDILIRLVPTPPFLTIKFSIHRKETFTGISIQSSSLHPRKHKLACINSAIHRLTLIPMDKKDIEDETNTLEQIAHINGLQLDIKKMIKRKIPTSRR